MRILIAASLLGAGLIAGAALPPVTGRIRAGLAAAGLTVSSPPSGEAGPAATAHEPGHEAADGIHVRMAPGQIANQEIALAPAEGGVLARHILVPGTVTPDADRVARVPVRVVGTVTEMRKRLGDRVAKGEVVAVLDSREVADAKSEYLTAQVQAELQSINFARQQKLVASQATSEASFQNARAAHLENQLRLDLARQKLSALGLNAAEVAAAQKRDEASPTTSSLRQYELRAPVEGQIVERKVDVGTAVGKEGEPADLYTVADLSTVWIELSVPTSALAGVREGAAVAVLAGRDEAGRRAEGRVIFVSPLLNAETRAARVVVTLPNGDGAWRPGTYVTAEIEIARDRVTVRVPKAALQTIEGKPVVFVRTEEGFDKREVELGRSDDDAVEAVSGLRPGETIVVANSFLLKAELGKSDAGHDD
jgi:cobalt-zinc-cadmium efflux system membrane fusion protein